MFSACLGKNCSVSLLVLSTLLASQCVTSAQDGPVSVGETGGSITAFVNSANRGVGFSGAVLAAKKGNVVAAVAVGSTNAVQPSPIETTTLFEIASATKPFTATAVLLLQQQGKLRLDDSIAKYLTGVPTECHSITVRHLLQHTSGIPGTNSSGRGDEVSVVLPMFLKGGPKHPPGTHWEYWNQGYALLTEIIARASDKSYVQYCRDEIFLPCGMRVSCFTGDHAPNGVKVATGVSSSGPPRTAMEHPYGSYGFQYRGMGGLVTNVWDIWRWDRALKSESLLNADSLRAMTTPGRHGYVLGWFTGTTSSGIPFHKHGGAVRGFLAEIRRYPAEDGCLIVFSNSDSQMPMTMTTMGCEQLLFGQKLNIDFPQPLKNEFLAAIVGEYKDERKRQLSIEREGTIARARILWGGPVTHGYIGTDVKGAVRLFEVGSNIPIEFQLGVDGVAKDCSLLKLKFDRVRDEKR